MVKALGGVGVRLCRDWWASQTSCNATGRVVWNTCSVIGSMRNCPASNRRGLAVLLCVRACGCLVKEKDYVSASVIGPAAGWKPQSEDIHMSVNRGDLMVIFHFHNLLSFWQWKQRKKEVSVAVVVAMLPSSVQCALWINPSHAPNTCRKQIIQLFTDLLYSVAAFITVTN